MNMKHLKCSSKWLDEALKSAENMLGQGMPISKNLAQQVVSECSNCQKIDISRRVYNVMVHSGLDSISSFTDPLIRQLASLGSLSEANQAFSNVDKPSPYTWNSLIAAHIKLGKNDVALQLYKNMQHEGINPDRFTFSSILKACSSLDSIKEGRGVHEQLIQVGSQSDLITDSALVDMYAKCGGLEEARNVFDRSPNRNVVTWGSMIAGYVQNAKSLSALNCFEHMQQEGIMPDKVTFLSILKACSSLGTTRQGRHIHEKITESGLQSDVIVGSALVDMYAKSGSLKEARRVFDDLPKRNVVTWGAMIGGYALHGEGLCALECFEAMERAGVKADNVIFLNVLKACTVIGAIEQGRNIHKKLIEYGLQSNTVIGNTLVDMYSKCGSMEEARMVFDRLLERDVVSWGAMIAGYAQCGSIGLARQSLEEMWQGGIKPDDTTFSAILATCSHAGLVDEGRKYFISMREDYGIIPDTRHYTCMVDLFARSGRLVEAQNLLHVIQPDIVGWTCLLAACRIYGNVELGRQCFDQIVQIDPRTPGAYVVMSAIYSDACMWTDAVRIEELRQQANVWKKPGKAWIEINNKVHEFIVGDKSHPKREEIYSKLSGLSEKMKEAGYMPKVELVLQQMSDEDKEGALCGHCEKLAIAFGLLSTPSGTTIRATKNLRMCMDCHNATKIISKIERREIVIRDAYHMHHFQDGLCSCLN